MIPHTAPSAKARPSRPLTHRTRARRGVWVTTTETVRALCARRAVLSDTQRAHLAHGSACKVHHMCSACLGLSFFEERTSSNLEERPKGWSYTPVCRLRNKLPLLTGVGHTTCRQSYMFLSIPIHETLPRGCTLTSQVFSTHDWYGKGAVYTEAEAPRSMAHVRFHKSQGISDQPAQGTTAGRV